MASEFEIKLNKYLSELNGSSTSTKVGDLVVEEVFYNKKHKSFLVCLKSSAFLMIDDLLELNEYIKKIIFSDIAKKVNVFTSYAVEDYKEVDKCLFPYYKFICNQLSLDNKQFLYFKDLKPTFDKENNILSLKISEEMAHLKALFPQISNSFALLGLKNLKINCTFEEKTTSINEIIAAEDQENLNKSAAFTPTKQAEPLLVQKTKRYSNKYNEVKIKEIPIDAFSLDKYLNNVGELNFSITGEIVNVEIRSLSTSTLISLLVTDYTDTIICKKFANPKNAHDEELLNTLKIGLGIKVDGKADFDKYSGEVCMSIYEVGLFPAKPRFNKKDDEPIKRIELHAHSKSTMMDSVVSIKDYFDYATHLGHKAIAICDTDALYAYPEIYKYAKNYKIKPIYGVEVSAVNDLTYSITNRNSNYGNIALNDAVSIVFDIETTGLSAQRDRIIQIAAVRIEKGIVVNRFNTFIEISHKLGAFTTQLTGIRDEDLKGSPQIKEAMQAFFEFIGEPSKCILVAHNASFDLGHLRKVCQKLNMIYPEFRTIDTLNLVVTYMYGDEKLKRYNLKALSKYFRIEQLAYHKADDDARVLGEIYIALVQLLKEKHSITHYEQIDNNYDHTQNFKYPFTNKLNILVKDQHGYKNIFEIVSQSLTTYLTDTPRCPHSLINKYRDGLYITSGSYESDLFEAALNKSQEELETLVSFYDIIEVQPVHAYKHIISDLVKNDEDGKKIVEETIRKIIKVANKYNKIVVATCNVHYLLKEEKELRKILVSTPIKGGRYNRLSSYSLEELDENYYMTTTEMLEAFSFLDKELAYEIVVENPTKVCDSIADIKAFSKELYAVADDCFKEKLGIESISNEVKRLVFDKIKNTYGSNPHPILLNRIKKELDAIIKHEFSANYYMSHLLVKKSNSNGFVVGSRGSVGSSVIATLLDITEVNPLPPHYFCRNCHFHVLGLDEEQQKEYGMPTYWELFQNDIKNCQSGIDLPRRTCPCCNNELEKDGNDIPFETFLGFKGDKIPDIDLNFSGLDQGNAHNYVKELFGDKYTYRAGTTLTAATETSYTYVEKYLIGNGINKRRAEINRIAQKIQNVRTGTGQHPGGIIVVPKGKTLTDVTPYQYPGNNHAPWMTTHFDYHSFEENLLKLDILGHDDPTMFKHIMDYVNLFPDEFPIKNVRDIPLDDPKTYELFSSVEVLGINKNESFSSLGIVGLPEFGTEFTEQIVLEAKPKTFAGLVKISGLSHGTQVWLKNAKDLIAGTTEYGKIAFDNIIGCRDDIMVQLIAWHMEPAISFEIMEFIRKGRPSREPAKWLEYTKIMRDAKIPEWYIWSCGQIAYMFPKAHAIAYVTMAVRIAWFKLYKPLVFYSAFFSTRCDKFDYLSMVSGSKSLKFKIEQLLNDKTDLGRKVKKTLSVAHEMSLRGFKFLPIDIDLSESSHFLIEDGALRMPLEVIDGLGSSVAKKIVEERRIKPYTSITDFIERTSVNKTVIEILRDSGFFKDLPEEQPLTTFGLFAQ